MNKQMRMRRRRKSHTTIPLALLQIFLSIMLLYAAGGGQFNLTVKDNVTGQTLPIFATTNGTAPTLYITNYVVVNPTNQMTFTIAPTPTMTVTKWDFGTASQPSSPITGDNKSVVAIPSTNSYSAPLPVKITSQHTDGTCPSTQTVAILIPLQLCLLNGSTADFDGTIITKVVASPENPAHDHDVAVAGGTDVMGVLPMGQGRADFPNNAYTVQTLVAAQAQASVTGLQYQWVRYITRRSWYIQKQGSTNSWYVTQRSSRGTTTPDDDTGSSESYNTTPSSVKHEFYFHDTSALAYGSFPNDTNGYMPVGSYILEEKAFTYQVNTSFDGTTWTSGVSLPVHQIITTKYQATGGTATTDWIGVPNLQGGNVYTNGTINPVITSTQVQAIVGSTNFTIDPTAND